MLNGRAVELRWQVTGTLPTTASYVIISHQWGWLTLMELCQCLTRAANGTKWRKWLTDCEEKEGLGRRAWWKVKGIMGIIRITQRDGEGAERSQKYCLCVHAWYTPLWTHKMLYNHLLRLNRCITVWTTWKYAKRRVTKAGNNCCWSYKVRQERKLKSNVLQFFLFHTHSLLFGGTWHAVLPTGNHQANRVELGD